MFVGFPYLINTRFASIHPCVWIKSSPILSCKVFHFRDFQRYFWPDFLSQDFRMFSLIPSVGLAARTSLIIYHQPWSESMTLAHNTHFLHNKIIAKLEVH
jgi:hypothetical protein